MKKTLCLIGLLIVFGSTSAAEIAYVDDQIKIWTHTGPSNQYKVKHKLSPGTRFEILQRDETTGFVEIKDELDRVSWMDSKFLTRQRTANLLLVDARAEIKKIKQTYTEKVQSLEKQLRELKPMESKNEELQQSLAQLESELEQASQKAQLYEKGFDRDAYFTGAVIVLTGMFLGWLLSRLGGRKRNTGWS